MNAGINVALLAVFTHPFPVYNYAGQLDHKPPLRSIVDREFPVLQLVGILAIRSGMEGVAFPCESMVQSTRDACIRIRYTWAYRNKQRWE